MTRRRPMPPVTFRNGLKWREGRPRWEPSPASRKAGIKGIDLKRADGVWMDRGEAVGAADARSLWASHVRAAMAPGAAGDDARNALRAALDRMTPPADDAARHKRELLADLFDAARTILKEGGHASPATPSRQRTVRQLADLYLADKTVDIAPATREAYTTQLRRLVAKLGDRRVAEVNRGQLIAYHRELIDGGLGQASANQVMGAAGSIFAWAMRQDPPWINFSPATKLGLKSAAGRLVFWRSEDEIAFIAWCDANGFEDVADGITAALWTGARPGDICAANLSDLAGKTWRVTPKKTRRHGNEALPAIMAPVRARVERRRAQLVTAIDGAFLIHPRTGRRHTADTLYDRFSVARDQICREPGAAPEDFGRLTIRDCRDTCITRLWEAEVIPERLWAWTGHSKKSIERILREHYLVLREEGSLAMAAKLEAWAARQHVAL